MIISIQVSMYKSAYYTSGQALESAEVEIAPEHLPCLDIREIAAKLAVSAFKEYLAQHPPEADEQEEGE